MATPCEAVVDITLATVELSDCDRSDTHPPVDFTKLINGPYSRKRINFSPGLNLD